MLRSTSLLQKAAQRIFVPNWKKKKQSPPNKKLSTRKGLQYTSKISMQETEESIISDEQPNFATKHNGDRRHVERYDFN